MNIKKKKRLECNWETNYEMDSHKFFYWLDPISALRLGNPIGWKTM